MPAKRRAASPEFFNFSDELLDSIARSFGLRIHALLPILVDGEFCSLLEARSSTSQKVILETDDGNFFLKQVPWYCDDERRLRFSHLFQAELTRIGLPVPRIIPSLSQGTWIEFRGQRFVLFDYCSGYSWDSSVVHLRAAARSLAWMHTTALPPITHAPAESVFETALAHVDLLAQCLVPRYGVPEEEFAKSFQIFQSTVLDEFRSRIESARFSSVERGWEDLRQQPNHGDFGPYNLIFSESGTVNGIVDFDNCTIDSRLHDIAEAILTFCSFSYQGDSTNFDPVSSFSLDHSRLKIFLSDYTSVSELSSLEWECLPYVMRAVQVELFCLGLIRGDFGMERYQEMLSLLDAEVSLFTALN